MQCPSSREPDLRVPSPPSCSVTNLGHADAAAAVAGGLWLPPIGCSTGALVGGGLGCARRPRSV